MSHQLPSSIAAEEAVLGSCLIDWDAIHRIAGIVQPGDFFREKNGWLFGAIVACAERDTPPDFVAVCDELENRGKLGTVGGPAYITSLIDTVPTSVHVEHYANIVRNISTRRQLIKAAGEIAGYAYTHDDPDDGLAFANNALMGIETHARGDGPMAAQDIVAEMWDDLQYWQENPLPPNKVRGISTGIVPLDRLMGGMDRGESLVIFAARPRVGKTALALASAYAAAAEHNYRVLWFSLEMKRRTLIARLATAASGVPFKKIKRGVKENSNWYASPDEYSRFMAEAAAIANAQRFYIDDSENLNAAQIRARAMKLARKLGGLDLICVDTGNLIESTIPGGMNFAQSESAKVRGIRNLVKELDCVGYITWQLNKGIDSRPAAGFGRRPTLGDLRDTGGVEEHASDVLGLYRDELYNPETEYKNIMEVIGLKRRNDEDSTVAHLFYDTAKQQFREAEITKQEIDQWQDRL